MDIQSKRAVVFGGTSGIGLAAVQRLAAAGAEVCAVSRYPDRAQKLVPDGVRLAACDTRDRDALASLFNELDSLDILVNAATGGKRPSGPFLEVDLDAYQGAFDKLWGYTNSVRLGAGHMTEDGAIVLVSGAPARRSRAGQTALASVGGAVEAFCRAVAVEIAPRRINVVCPGFIDTPMFGPEGSQRESTLREATAQHIIDRPGTADEVAAAILFVIENSFVTGTTVDVDGGWMLT